MRIRLLNTENIMHRLTILVILAAINGFLFFASAQAKTRLAQSSVATECMMSCNSRFASCQSSCVATETAPSSTGAATFNPVQTCISSCTSQELECQIVCARESPSQ